MEVLGATNLTRAAGAQQQRLAGQGAGVEGGEVGMQAVMLRACHHGRPEAGRAVQEENVGLSTGGRHRLEEAGKDATQAFRGWRTWLAQACRVLVHDIAEIAQIDTMTK